MSTELRQQLALLYAQARASGHNVTPEQIKVWFDEAMDTLSVISRPSFPCVW